MYTTVKYIMFINTLKVKLHDTPYPKYARINRDIKLAGITRVFFII